jgi:hypothetical protein
MEREKLKKFVFDEFKKEAPWEIAADEEKFREFILKNIDEALLDRLVDEFCAKNPKEFEVLNVFMLSDEQIDEIKKNPGKAIADGTIDRIKYEKIINHAGLAYQKNAIHEQIAQLVMITAQDN